MMNCKISFGFVASLALLGLVRTGSSGTSCPELLAKMKSNSCCNLPKILPEDTLKECKLNSNTFRGNSRLGMKSIMGGIRNAGSMPCKMECVFKKLGLINETANRVDTDAAKAAVVQNAPEAWKDAAGTAGNICSTALNTLYAKIDSSPMPDLGFKPACKPCSFLYSTCITVELIANCPSPSNSSACTSIADSYKTCASNITAFFPPPPLQRNRP